MPLNDLSLAQMKELADDLASLAKVGQGLAPLNPIFDLTPGQSTRITLDQVMPDVSAPSPVETFLANRAEYLDRQMAERFPSSIEAAPDLTQSGEAGPARPEPVEPPPAAGDSAGGELPRDWTESEEHRVAEIYARNRLLTPMCDPVYEATEATGREMTHIRAYVTAYLYPLCDQHLEHLRAAAVRSAGGNSIPAQAGTLSAEAQSRSDDDGDPLQVTASPEAEAESGGGAVMAAAIPPAAPAPGSASALAESGGWAKVLWTEAEDDRLVALIVGMVTTQGLTKSAALPLAAAELGRPVAGTEFRANRKLKDRINLAIQAAALRQAQTETPEIPEAAAGAPGQGDAAAVGGTPAAVQPSPEAARQDAPLPQAEVQGESAEPHGGDAPEAVPEPASGATPADLHGLDLQIWQYLQRHRPRWPLTIGTDLDLVEALGRGEKLSVIAADLGIDAAKLKDRFQVLTGMIVDARDRPTIDGMRRLVEVLRRIVADAPSKAA